MPGLAADKRIHTRRHGDGDGEAGREGGRTGGGERKKPEREPGFGSFTRESDALTRARLLESPSRTSLGKAATSVLTNRHLYTHLYMQ